MYRLSELVHEKAKTRSGGRGVRDPYSRTGLVVCLPPTTTYYGLAQRITFLLPLELFPLQLEITPSSRHYTDRSYKLAFICSALTIILINSTVATTSSDLSSWSRIKDTSSTNLYAHYINIDPTTCTTTS
ncbi:unnamed protein product [Clavelina lepadiformis]|uniref:Uncharacterized protein n=1 Tax=Clavelina lepadiformis TaxID=159417 RepID=A0ABP0G862_CLALP